VRPDNNIFSSLCTAFILKNYLHELQKDEMMLALKMIGGVIACLPSYKNAKGRNTYNFWQNQKKSHFPFGKFMRHLKHFKLPDDIDDTSLAFLVKDYTEDEILELRQLLIEHAHPDLVYDTWFGVNMPKEKDVCALCNLIYLLFESGTSLNKNDHATLAYLNDAITSGKYLTDTFWVSRHYASVPLIVYHYTRLISRFNPPQLAGAKEHLLSNLTSLLSEETTKTERLLLEISARKLEVSVSHSRKYKSGTFYSFIGAPFAPLRVPFLRKIASHRSVWIGWKCHAHELALLFENEVLKNR
jgi:hypothetical protein